MMPVELEQEQLWTVAQTDVEQGARTHFRAEDERGDLSRLIQEAALPGAGDGLVGVAEDRRQSS